MKRYFKYYAICWIIGMILFNVVSFATVSATIGFDNLTSTFWVAYAFIIAIMLVNLGCGVMFFRENDRDKTFLNLPTAVIAYTSLIITLAASTIVVMIPGISPWVAVIVDSIILCFTLIALVGAKAGEDIVSRKEKEVKQQTAFIKLLSVDAQTLCSKATDEAKASVNKVYEAIRYSDPMSAPALAAEESRIQAKFDEYSNAVSLNEVNQLPQLEKELIILIDNRNNKCKALK